MKKIICILLLTISASLTFSSCTEEEVAPIQTNNSSDAGGGTSFPGKP